MAASVGAAPARREPKIVNFPARRPVWPNRNLAVTQPASPVPWAGILRTTPTTSVTADLGGTFPPLPSGGHLVILHQPHPFLPMKTLRLSLFVALAVARAPTLGASKW